MNNSAPDPMGSAATQAMFNLMAAKEQQKMNMVSQNTPYGSLTYGNDPNAPSGYSATQTFSPEVQKVLDTNISNAQGMGDAQGQLLGNINNQITQPLDLSYGANAQRLADLQKQTLDPLWNEKTNQFNVQMANRGVMPGSAAYDSAYRDFSASKDAAYRDMFLNAYNTTNNAAMQQYNTPLNALASLRSGSQIAQPVQSLGLTTTPQGTVQPANYQGAQQSAYAANSANNNSFMGGLFGLGGTLLGML